MQENLNDEGGPTDDHAVAGSEVSQVDGAVSGADAQEGTAAQLSRRASGLPTYLSLSRVVAAIGVLSFWAYLVLYQASFGYLGMFGATPEEVGLDQPTYVVHAALLASVGAFIASFAFIALGGATISMAGLGRLFGPPPSGEPTTVAGPPRQSTPIGTHIWSKGEVGSIRRRTAGVVLGVSLLVYLSLGLNPGYVANPFRASSDAVAGFVVLFAIICGGFWLLAQWRWVACVLVGSAVVVAATVTSAQAFGERLARDVITGRSTPLPLSYFGLQGDVVRVQVFDSTSPSAGSSGPGSERPALPVPSCLYLLGHSDGVLVLADGSRLYRVNDRAVVLVQTASGTSCNVQ